MKLIPSTGFVSLFEIISIGWLLSCGNASAIALACRPRVLGILLGAGASVLVLISFALFITGDLLCRETIGESWPRNRGVSFVY